jgi:hypothetical protein
MKIAITYAEWEGDPAILVHFEDGHVHGYFCTGEHKSWHFGAVVAAKASQLTRVEYEARFSGVGLPPWLKDPRLWQPLPQRPPSHPKHPLPANPIGSAYADLDPFPHGGCPRSRNASAWAGHPVDPIP